VARDSKLQAVGRLFERVAKEGVLRCVAPDDGVSVVNLFRFLRAGAGGLAAVRRGAAQAGAGALSPSAEPPFAGESPSRVLGDGELRDEAPARQVPGRPPNSWLSVEEFAARFVEIALARTQSGVGLGR